MWLGIPCNAHLPDRQVRMAVATMTGYGVLGAERPGRAVPS